MTVPVVTSSPGLTNGSRSGAGRLKKRPLDGAFIVNWPAAMLPDPAAVVGVAESAVAAPRLRSRSP